MPHSRLARKRQPGRPAVLDHLDRQLGKEASAAAQVDAARQALAAGELLDAERQALQQDLRVRAQELGDLAVLVRGQQTLGVAQLASFGLLIAETEGQR